MPLPVVAGAAAAAALAGGGGAAGGGTMAALLGGGMGGALLSGGMGLFGGSMKNSTELAIAERNLHWQRRLAMEGIRFRVADARAAGVHPLYALGAPPMTSFPVQMNDAVGPAIAEMGQNVGNVVNRALDQNSRDRHALDMAIGAAQLRESDARTEMYLSEAARNRQQPSTPAIGFDQPPNGMDGQNAVIPGMYQFKLPEVEVPKPGHSDMKAGIQRGNEVIELGPEFYQVFPNTKGESQEEIQSEMSPWRSFGNALLNRNLQGKEWFKDWFYNRFFGVLPRYRYRSFDDPSGKLGPYAGVELRRPEDYKLHQRPMSKLAEAYRENRFYRYRKLREFKEFMRDKWMRFWHPSTYPAFPKKKKN